MKSSGDGNDLVEPETRDGSGGRHRRHRWTRHAGDALATGGA
jgi:hypothetical protein